MKIIYLILKKRIKNLLSISLIAVLLLITACSDEKECGYTTQSDCPNLGLNFGVPCDYNNDGIMNGIVDDSCECIPNFEIINSCPGFIQNGDFEIVTGNPNSSVDNDIDLATGWKPLWQSGSLADLFNNSTTNFGASCFSAPSPLSSVFAGMWVENNNNPNASATFREGFFNELNATINKNTSCYTLNFKYSNMSEDCGDSNDIKVGIYGVYFAGGSLPNNPTGVGNPSNLDLFGASNTVFLGEITISSSTTNAWTSVNITIDTNTLNIPSNGINHIMISNSHLTFESFGRMFIGFDDFCLINSSCE